MSAKTDTNGVDLGHVRNVSATDVLRQMLTELGVKYKANDKPVADHTDWQAWMHGDKHQSSGAMRRETLWDTPTNQNDEAQDTYRAKATEVNGELFLEARSVTPEQAIAATLGNYGVAVTVVPDEYTAKLMAEVSRLQDELSRLQGRLDMTETMAGARLGLAKQRAKEVDRLKTENAKLRVLVRDYENCSVHADCETCEYDGNLSTHCPLSPCFPDTDELYELGIEVDK